MEWPDRRAGEDVNPLPGGPPSGPLATVASPPGHPHLLEYLMTTLTHAGVARTTKDLVLTDGWRGLAATTEDGRGLVVDLVLHTHERADGGLYPTIDHGMTASYSELVIVWTILTTDGLASRPHQPDRVVVASAAPVLDATDWAGLRVLWERWHCAALSPGCSHQAPPPGDVRTQLRTVKPCPTDGYLFGSGWLVRDLPSDVETRARQIGAALEVSR